MKKQTASPNLTTFYLLLTTFLLAAFCGFGCSHNIVNYTNGDLTSLGVTLSESGYPIFGWKRISGENLTAAVKDNTLMNVNLENGANADSSADKVAGKASRMSGMLLYTGDQTTGNDVNMAEAIAKYDLTQAKELAAKKNATFVDAKLDETGKLVVTEVKLGETAANSTLNSKL